MRCTVEREDCPFCNLPSPWTPVVQGAINEWATNHTYLLPFKDLGQTDTEEITNVGILMNSILYALRIQKIHRGQIAVWICAMRGATYNRNEEPALTMEVEIIQRNGRGGPGRQRGPLITDPGVDDCATALSQGHGQLFSVNTEKEFHLKFNT